MRILILGANGFIGSAVTAALTHCGHAVTGLARDVSAAARRLPHIEWRQADLAGLKNPADWLPLLDAVDVVVNCAGALQDGARDDVAAVQDVAMRALYQAGSRLGLIVQISARTDGSAAATAFLTSKRSADDALKRSSVPYVILRPAMVIGRNAHGGSALLRALAAFPLVTPLVHAESPIQFAALDDVAHAVAEAVEGRIPPGSDLDIAAPETLTLRQTVARHRAWLGLPPARSVGVPPFAARTTAGIADLLGWLGWRSPLRSTAMLAAQGGILAAPSSLPFPPKTLDATLRDAPAGVQDLWFARLYLMKPLVFGTLALFWLLSGIIALARFDVSSAHLVAAGLPASAAWLLTLLTSLADILLGVGVAVRRFSAICLKGMIALSLAYLAGATLLQPALWLDPLGPLVKVLPSIVLALAALAILEER